MVNAEFPAQCTELRLEPNLQCASQRCAPSSGQRAEIGRNHAERSFANLALHAQDITNRLEFRPSRLQRLAGRSEQRLPIANKPFPSVSFELDLRPSLDHLADIAHIVEWLEPCF
jgi:hypothetical protein